MGCQFVYSQRTRSFLCSHGLEPEIVAVLGSVAVWNSCQSHEPNGVGPDHVHYDTYAVGLGKFGVSAVSETVVDGCRNEEETVDEGGREDRSEVFEGQFD